jgi:RNA polymerase sigma factor (sigma-70 family)
VPQTRSMGQRVMTSALGPLNAGAGCACITSPAVHAPISQLSNAHQSGKLLLLHYRNMDFSEADLEKLRPRLRFKVCYRLGFACPDVDDIVQETLTRFLSIDPARLHNADGTGAYLNGICQNVIMEYRRRCARDTPLAHAVPEASDERLADTELFGMRQAIAAGMQELSCRDRQVLRAFYLEERPKREILEEAGLTDENFRVVLCRAKERFRRIYVSKVKHRGASGHK